MPRSSGPALALQLAVVVCVAAALGVIGLPTLPLSFGAAVIGVALVIRWSALRREAAAAQTSAGQIYDYPVRIPVAAQRLGRVMQLRWSAGNAPGMLCARSGYAAFFPATHKHRSLAWEGSVGAVQVRGFGGRASALRVHGPSGTHQLTSLLAAAEVVRALDGTLRIVDGWTVEDPTG